jgi:hypothetical protein
MNRLSACPDMQQWQQLASGQTSDAEAAPLEEHLLECSTCLQTVRRMAAADPLVEALAGSGRLELPTPTPATDGLLGKLKELVPATDLPGAETGAEAPATGNEVSPAGWSEELRSLLAPPQRPDEVGRLGGYRVLQVLGRGGMGVVFLAEDEALQRCVALKTLAPARAAVPSARQRFLNEARAMAAIKHPHVATIYQVGEDRGVPFLAMELLEGESLDSRLRREGKLPAAEVVRIGREAAEGLAAAHGRGLVHRDVKPANLWLEFGPDAPRSGEGGLVKVLDFGLVRAADGEPGLTASGMAVGTPTYMAPEQAQGDPVDARADLFALGCVLYRACTGQLPFRGRDAGSVLRAILSTEPPAPHAIDPEVPPALSDLIVRLLAKDPNDRPAGAQVVAQALEAIGRGGTTADLLSARTAPTPEPRRPRRRRWALAAAAVVVLVLLAAGVAWRLRQPVAAVVPGPAAPLHGWIDVLIWEEKNPRRQNLRLSDFGAMPIKPGDQFCVEAELNRPAYVYVLWVHPDGQVYPVYPWRPGHWEERPAPEKPVAKVRRPEALDEFYELPADTPGMVTLVLLARETPLPPEVDLRAELGDLRPQTEQDLRATVWFENGEAVQDDPGRRAMHFDVKRRNDPVLAAQERIRSRLLGRHFAYARAVSFACQGK